MLSILGGLSLAAIGLVCLVIFATAHWLKRVPKIRAIFAFIAVCLLGLGGVVGHLLTDITTWVAGLLGVATTTAVGTEIGALILVIPLGWKFLDDLYPKHSASASTSWVGIALAVILVSGISGIAVLNEIPGAVQTGVTNVQTSLGG